MNPLNAEYRVELFNSDGPGRHQKLIEGAETLFRNGDLDDGLTYLKASLELAETLGSSEVKLDSLWALAFKNFELGDYNETSHFATKGVVEAQKCFDSVWEQCFSILWADSEFHQGNFDLVERLLSSTSPDEGPNKALTCLGLRRLAQVRQLRNADTLEDWQSALELAFSDSEPSAIGESAVGLASFFRRAAKKVDAYSSLEIAWFAAEEAQSWRQAFDVAIEILLSIAKWGEEPQLEELLTKVANSATWNLEDRKQRRALLLIEKFLEVITAESSGNSDTKGLSSRCGYLSKAEPELFRKCEELINELGLMHVK